MSHSAPAESLAAMRTIGLRHMVGNTPLLAIDFTFRGQPRTLFAKSEQLNMTGSIKDRMAMFILERAYARGELRPGDRIVEASSGNTGISFAALGKSMGHPVTIFMPDWMSRERHDLIRSLGADIVSVSREQGGFVGSIRMAQELREKDQAIFLPSQFSNTANVDAHFETTGPEIWWQLQFASLLPDAFVAGVGTGGTVMGVGKYLRSQNPKIRVHPLEPAESPTLRTGCKVGSHRIQGISDEFIPQIVDLPQLDSPVDAADGDSILMAQKLAAQLGLAVGISSGANFLGALKVQEELGPKAVVVTIFPDDNKKYLSTGLMKEEPVREDYLSPHVSLRQYRAYKRVCHTCCDMYECTQKVTPHIQL